MQGNLFYGSGVALVTPFRGQRVDYDCLESLIDWQIDSETDAIIILGTTGEPCTISPSERSAIIECAVARCAGRLPVYVGTGSNCTKTAVNQSVEAMRLGADGLLVVTPYYNKTSAAGLKEHYLTIADSVNIPIIAYNVPSRTGLNMPPEVMLELAKHPLLCGFKEAGSSIAHSMRLFELVGDGVAIYSGNDDQVLPMMALGARGVISVAANIVPRQMHAMALGWLRGEISASRSMQFSLLPLIRALFAEVNPIPVKAALAMMGKIEDTLRPPLLSLDKAKAAELKKQLQRLRLIDPE
ncbi:MAG: 4-hydroxy-tetrahydrodipicolinate synthase [Clostridia bacterium]|nr:4-hydroxy-tetrahydrodipicolinate synthase [Clostridia bacterium]